MAQGQLSFRGPGGGAAGAEGGGTKVLGVSQVVRGVNRLLETRFGLLCVEGEVTGFKIGGSGHAYFTLKDEQSALPIAMWRTALERLQFQISDGQSIRVFGRLGIFVKNARFQFYAERAEPAGQGARMLELEQTKARLAAEGLFDVDRKRPIPRFPRVIGVVTSAHGAAVHDIIKVARRRCPSRILLAPAVVQGPDAPPSLVRALGRLARNDDVDVIILGRGGGSAEDLWAFNDERLARAIAASPVPVVSAVGHEVDVSICDLVADVRAATPSHAAELVVPDRAAMARDLTALQRRGVRGIERAALDERSRLDQLLAQLSGRARRVAAHGRSRLRDLERRLATQHPRAGVLRNQRRLRTAEEDIATLGRQLTAAQRLRLDALEDKLAIRGRTLGTSKARRSDGLYDRLRRQGRLIAATGRSRWARAGGALDALSPLAVLERGYAVVTDAGGRALTDATDVAAGTALHVRLRRGSLRVRTVDTEPDDST